MRGIVATSIHPERRDIVWLNDRFGMMASSPKRGLGSNLAFGGVFTSPPVAVAAMANAPRVAAADVTGAAMADANSSGQGSATPDEGGMRGTGVLGETIFATRTHRLDLFGLGLDYAMYHKRFWGEHDRNDLSPWRRLGGIFVSAPAAIARGERVDVFGLGTDHALFTRSIIGDVWGPDWQRLGGAFTSAPSLLSRSPTTLDLFIRGADFTLRANRLEEGSWFGWQNLGGELASPPVAVSWGPYRIDVFAIFRDGTLRRRWWDGQIWNDWESFGGDYVEEPAAICREPGSIDVFAVSADRKIIHHRHEDQTWLLPETVPTGTTQVVSGAPAIVQRGAGKIELIFPVTSGNIRIVEQDGGPWRPSSAGARARLPGRYRISVDYIEAVTPRALNRDTVAVALTVTPGAARPQIRTQWAGKLGGTSPSTSQTNLLKFDALTIDLAEPMSISYLAVNNGHAPQADILRALASAGDSLGVGGSLSMQEQIGRNISKIISVKLVGLAAALPTLGGSILKIAAGWLLGKLQGALFESCDGIVAAELRALTGRELFMLTDNGLKTVTFRTRHDGTESSFNCGDTSEYEVTWTIKPL
jgi:hypothetical protein